MEGASSVRQRRGRSPSPARGALRVERHTEEAEEVPATVAHDAELTPMVPPTPTPVPGAEEVDGDGFPITPMMAVAHHPLQPPQAFLVEENHPFSWLFKPHTITALLVGFAAVIYLSFFHPQDHSNGEINLKNGLLVVAIIFLTYCVVQLRDNLIIRPHPAVWRFVHGVAILYLLFLVFLVVQPTQAARISFFRLFFPDHGHHHPTEDKSYANDCRIYTPESPNGPFANIVDAFYDIFAFSHFLGWVGKAILVREWGLLWGASILWELLEYAFQDSLVNFHECWWDHWILDVLVCNGGGIFVGMVAVHFLEMKKFDWTGLQGHDNEMEVMAGTGGKKLVSPIPSPRLRPAGSPPLSLWDSVTATTKNVFLTFTPYEYVKYEWHMFSSLRRFAASCMVVVVINIIEMGAFTLKHVLYIPPPNPLNPARLVLWWALAIPALREWYQYIVDPKCKRLGQNVWLGAAIIVAEVLVSYKFAHDSLSIVIPRVALIGWPITLVCVALWAVLRFQTVAWTGLFAKIRPVLMNGLIVGAVIPQLVIMWFQEDGFGNEGRKLVAQGIGF